MEKTAVAGVAKTATRKAETHLSFTRDTGAHFS
jgi:hypothetical protein